MQYEYNGNLEAIERINEVCNDIKREYGDIPLEKLKKIAALESPITETVNYKMKFKRLYNILLIINNDISLSNTYDKVIKDIINVYNNISKNEIKEEDKILNNILKFKNNTGDRFYIISNEID